MGGAYCFCHNITGSPVCGPKVTIMGSAYRECFNLTGSPVCGPNVNGMYETYKDSYNLIGDPVCGPNVNDMCNTYYNCHNLSGNMYMYSDNVYAKGCFYNRNTANRLNIYVNKNTTSFNTVLINNTQSLVGSNITWTNNINSSNAYDLYYNDYYNIYVYAVDNVQNIKPYKYNAITMKNED